MTETKADKALQQRRKQVALIAERRRSRTKCSKGHNNWRIGKDGRRRCKTCKHQTRKRNYRTQPGPYDLLPKEIDVLQAAANGLTIVQQAKYFHYAEQTIKLHRRTAKLKLGTDNLTVAVAVAIREGIIR